ncbi:hypothetical protein NNG48_07105 [Enterococcus faecium]|nr:hypothetical protein [Enterococcus faecium]
MNISQLIERLKQFEKVYGEDMPVALEIGSEIGEIAQVYVDKFIDIAIIRGEKP